MKLWGALPALSVCLGVIAAEPPLDPVPVCEALSGWKSLTGRAVAIVGRYSFRGSQRWLDQEACDGKERGGKLWLEADAKTAPKPPDTIALDERALERQILTIKQHTSLGKFRFGSPDYDRWAVVFGRLETRNEHDFQLVYRGDGAVFFFVDK